MLGAFKIPITSFVCKMGQLDSKFNTLEIYQLLIGVCFPNYADWPITLKYDLFYTPGVIFGISAVPLPAGMSLELHVIIWQKAPILNMTIIPLLLSPCL